ncbi:phosphotransferase [Streptomyces sp. NBC_01352]|uniref:phosphotransferase n=1 Tax=Streptomyces sp. NBC_01352 TaxID=2903834 RepID=UPI003FCCBE25
MPDAGRDLSARRVAEGKSNLTYEVTQGTSTWIVRSPPLGHVLQTAHDMARDYRVMSALQATAVVRQARCPVSSRARALSIP